MLTRHKCGKMWITRNARNRLSIDCSEAPKSLAISGGAKDRVYLYNLTIVVIPTLCLASQTLAEPMP